MPTSTSNPTESSGLWILPAALCDCPNWVCLPVKLLNPKQPDWGGNQELESDYQVRARHTTMKIWDKADTVNRKQVRPRALEVWTRLSSLTKTDQRSKRRPRGNLTLQAFCSEGVRSGRPIASLGERENEAEFLVLSGLSYTLLVPFTD